MRKIQKPPISHPLEVTRWLLLEQLLSIRYSHLQGLGEYIQRLFVLGEYSLCAALVLVVIDKLFSTIVHVTIVVLLTTGHPIAH